MKILSIDFGSNSVKAVEFESSFGRIELLDYKIALVEEIEVLGAVSSAQAPEANAQASDANAEAGEPEEAAAPPPRKTLTPGQVQALRQILREKDYKFDKLVVNLPKAWATSRIFHFPTKDRKTIQSSIAFELDDEIPFDLEQVVHDFAILNFDGAQSTVFSSIVKKEDLQDTISELQMLGLDPDVVTVEAWAFSQLMKRVIPEEYKDRPVCVLNLGASQTGIYMLVGSGPVLVRSCPVGGDDVSEAIAQSYGLTFEQAEKAKVEGGFVLTQTHLTQHTGSVTKEQIRFSSVITEALQPVLKEIKQVLIAYKTQTRLMPKAVFLTGGTSLLPNLHLYFEEILQIPVFQLKYMSQLVGDTLRLAESTEAQISVATGLAASTIKPERFATINFRKDDFSKTGGLGALTLKRYKRPLMFAAASLGFVYANLFVQWLVLSSREAKQSLALERSIKGVMGAVSPSVMRTYLASPSTLKNDINKEMAKHKDPTIMPSKKRTSAFDVLNKVSRQMPRNVVIDVTKFDFKDERLSLAGYLSADSGVDRVQQALLDTGVLTQVTISKQEMDPKLKKRFFEMAAQTADAQDAAGSPAGKGASNVKAR